MNLSEKKLLELIKQSQFGSTRADGDVYCDDEVCELAKQQAVLSLVAFSIIDATKRNEIEIKNVADYIRYNYAEEQLIITMNNAGIHLVIIKGNASAVNYSTPSRRTMGDIDFLIPMDELEKARSSLKENGYIEWSYDNRHIEYKKNDVVFELHYHYSRDVDIENYLVDGIKNPQNGMIDDHEFPMLPKLANGLVLLDHMGRHLKTGLGLRQVIDWMMYVYRELDDEFWEKEFSRVAKEKGLNTLAIVTTRMCQIYLGLPETITWCKDADEKVCEQLMENLLASGNFGRKQGKGSSVETVSTSIKRKGLFRWLQYAGEHNWEAYHKHHWLKPFCWFYQIFRYAKQGFKSGRSREELSGDLNRSEQRYELLKKLGIE